MLERQSQSIILQPPDQDAPAQAQKWQTESQKGRRPGCASVGCCRWRNTDPRCKTFREGWLLLPFWRGAGARRAPRSCCTMPGSQLGFLTAGVQLKARGRGRPALTRGPVPASRLRCLHPPGEGRGAGNAPGWERPQHRAGRGLGQSRGWRSAEAEPRPVPQAQKRKRKRRCRQCAGATA